MAMSLQDAIDLFEDSSDFEFLVPVASGSAHDDDKRPVPFLDESGLSSRDVDSFFLAGFEYGPSVLIHARSFDAAWEAWIDESETIPKSELIEAYGIIDSEFAKRYREEHPSPPWHEHAAWKAWREVFEAACHAELQRLGDLASDGSGEYPELIEGYEMQSNCTGTGIVNVGDYAWMNEIDADEIEIRRKGE